MDATGTEVKTCITIDLVDYHSRNSVRTWCLGVQIAVTVGTCYPSFSIT
jgi:hypothetical protein